MDVHRQKRLREALQCQGSHTSAYLECYIPHRTPHFHTLLSFTAGLPSFSWRTIAHTGYNLIEIADSEASEREKAINSLNVRPGLGGHEPQGY